MSAHNRSRYGRYAGGPDPLAPPVDLTEALDAVAEDVMAGYSPRRALQEYLRRASVRGEDNAVARIIDLEAAVDVLAGKIEFESGEEGREQDILDHLLRMATAETVRAHLHGIDLGPLVSALDGSSTVTTGQLVTAKEFLEGLPALNGSRLYDEVGERLGADNDGQRAAAVELALEGLYLARRISKDSDDEATVYG